MRKSNLQSYTALSNGAMSGTSTLTSDVTNITVLDDIGYQFDWTGSPTGTFQVEVSANYNQDNNGNVISAGTWIPLLVSYFNGTTIVQSYSIPTSVGTPIYVECQQLSAPWIRAVYTNASGTGTLTSMTICGKMV